MTTLAPFMGAGPQEPFHPGWKPAEHQQGVLFFAPWEDPSSGFAEHGRRLVRALADTGMPVSLHSLDPTMQLHATFGVGGADQEALRGRMKQYVDVTMKNALVSILHLVPSDEVLERKTTHPHIDSVTMAKMNRFKIISTVWERDRCSAYSVERLNRVGMVWTATKHDKAMLERCGVERVAVVPLPHFPDDPLLSLRGRQRYKGPVRFYHIGKWEPRKAQHGAIGAFLTAFKPGEAKFFMKTSTTAPDFEGYPKGPDYAVHEWLKDPDIAAKWPSVEVVNQDLRLIRHHLTDEQIVELHRTGDVYVTLSRAEGWDMPGYDAKLAGNLAVYTPSGGPQEFCHDSDDVLVPTTGLVPCHPFYRWGDAQYYDWKLAAGAHGLRLAWHAVRQETAERRAKRHQYELEDFEENGLTAAEAGKTMRQCIDRVVDEGRARL